ncbi:putative steryl acetyl hydrolase [Spathaspora sp. JA1]|nr:putative steryl acetyl hydrolase [Spathaspora sp. JA1]
MASVRGIYLILSIPFKLLYILVKYPIFGGINEKFRKSLINSLKVQLCRGALAIPVRDCALINILSNHFLINNLMKSLHPKLTQLPNYGVRFDQQSFWLVKAPHRSRTDPILIYLHGGGYYIETMPSQLDSVLAIYNLVTPEKRKKLSILHLDYKLASNGYPVATQMYQLAETYARLVAVGNDNFILMGDSAGGHLAVTFLQYIRHSYATSLPSPTTLIYPKSVILISPWCKIMPEDKQYEPGCSWYDNYNRDMIQFHIFREEHRHWDILGDTDHQALIISPGNHPYSASEWNSIPTLNNENYHVCVIVGEHESFRDDILEWCKYALKCPLYDMDQNIDSGGKLDVKKHEYIQENGEGGGTVQVYVEPWGLHDAVFFFENSIIGKFKGKGALSVDSFDDKEFFGIVRVVKFLNDTLEVKDYV